MPWKATRNLKPTNKQYAYSVRHHTQTTGSAAWLSEGWMYKSPWLTSQELILDYNSVSFIICQPIFSWKFLIGCWFCMRGIFRNVVQVSSYIKSVYQHIWTALPRHPVQNKKHLQIRLTRRQHYSVNVWGGGKGVVLQRCISNKGQRCLFKNHYEPKNLFNFNKQSNVRTIKSKVKLLAWLSDGLWQEKTKQSSNTSMPRDNGSDAHYSHQRCGSTYLPPPIGVSGSKWGEVSRASSLKSGKLVLPPSQSST